MDRFKKYRNIVVGCTLCLLLCSSIGIALIQNRWGLRSQYYTNIQWEGEPVVSMIEPISIKEDDGIKILATNTFSVKWTGWIEIPRAGTYRFATNSDDGSFIRINGQTLVDNGGAHGLRKVSQEMYLNRDVYPFEVLYFQIGGESVMRALWVRPGEPEKLIPQKALFSEHPRRRDLLFRKGVSILAVLIKIAWLSVLCILCGVGLKVFFSSEKIRQDRKAYVKIVGIIILIFAISSNLAWLNPPRSSEVKGGKFMKFSETIPFMWQYSSDSKLEIVSAGGFPSVFKTIPMRINRPLYPMIVHYLGDSVAYFTSLFVKLAPFYSTAIGYILLKLWVYILGAILMYQLLLPFYQNRRFWAVYAVALTFFHHFSIENIAKYHTTELQVISPIIILYLFTQLVKSYSVQKNIIFSIIIGSLMLAKQNYAVYLAVLLYALLYWRFKEVAISTAAHFIPLLLWLAFLHVYGLEYYNHEAVAYSQGVWLYQEFIQLNVFEMIQTVLNFVESHLMYAVKHYSIWLFLAFLALGGFSFKRKKDVTLLFLLCMGTTWLQWFAARRYDPYMTADYTIFVFGMATMALCRVFKRKSFLYGIMALWIFINILSFVRFPWVHPYNH